MEETTEPLNNPSVVICKECGKEFKVITVQHLKKEHNMDFTEYKNKYPGVKTVSEAVSKTNSFKNSNLFKKSKTLNQEDIIIDKEEQEIKIEECDDFDLDKIPIIPKEFTESVSNFIEEVKTFTKETPSKISEFPDPTNSINKDKLKILSYLVSLFPDLKNSYFVEKLSISGSLEFRLVTDMCLPSKRIDFEFPNTFWHNQDIQKSSRDSMLKNIGWKIIDFPGPKPSLTEIKEILKINKLIKN